MSGIACCIRWPRAVFLSHQVLKFRFLFDGNLLDDLCSSSDICSLFRSTRTVPKWREAMMRQDRVSHSGGTARRLPVTNTVRTTPGAKGPPSQQTGNAR